MNKIDNIASSGILFDGRYKLLRPLSSDGGTADVWLALDTNTIDEVYDDEADKLSSEEESGIKVAIKIYRPKNALDFGEQRFREEFKIVFNCHHTNLVQPINFSIFEGIPYLVLPFCRNGSSERLQKKINRADELWKYISDVSAGLAYLHAFNPTIVHHDIKPANVLIDDLNNYAITDFGISSHRGLNHEGYDDDSKSGTMAYMAPERFREDYESIPESDIWSFGATLYELITGKVPFGENGGAEQLKTGEACQPINADIPSDIKRLIYDCLSVDVAKRPSAAEINKAAEARCYPPGNKKARYTAVAGIGMMMVIGLLVFLVFGANKKEQAITDLSYEERFNQAMLLLATESGESILLGLSMLDTLDAQGYVPAIYEKAYTYGWYADSASVRRKELLGIEVYPAGSEGEYMPKEHEINTKATNLFSRIEDLGDSDYPAINAKALYRLACYYVNPNRVYQPNEERAKDLLKKAQKWAEQSKDTLIMKKINDGLKQFN